MGGFSLEESDRRGITQETRAVGVCPPPAVA